MSTESVNDYTCDQWRDVAARELATLETRLFIDSDYRDSAAGGCKQSGNARDKCFESLLAYTQTKSAWIRLSTG